MDRDIIKNCSTLEIEMCDGKHMIESNEVHAHKVHVNVLKAQSCNFVVEGSIIEYSFKICNESMVDIFDAEFKDILDEHLEYVDKSFRFSGTTGEFHKHDQEIIFKIKKLEARKEVHLCFKAKVL